MPTVIAVTETWMASDTEAQLKKNQLDGYTLHHCQRNTGMRGGAGLYVKNGIKYQVRDDIRMSQAESKWIEMNSAGGQIIVGVIYSSEKNRNREHFVHEIDEILDNFNNKRKKAVILGDMNIDLFRIGTRDQYFQTLQTNGFYNLIAFPTRVTEESETLIDHVYSNIHDWSESPISGTIENDISDHYTTFAVYPKGLERNTKETSPPTKVLSFKHYDPQIALEKMQSIDWEDVHRTKDVNECYRTFSLRVHQEQSRVIPTVEIKQKQGFSQPWMTPGIRRSQKERYRLYKKSKFHPKNENRRKKYQQYRNQLCKIMKTAERNYYSRLIQEADGDQGKTWHIINDIMGRKKRKAQLPEKLITNDDNDSVPVQGDEQVMNSLNEFFVNVGPGLASKISGSRKSAEEYLVPLKNNESFALTPVTEYEVLGMLLKLHTNKACGADGLHPKYIKDIAEVITAPLTHIINLSIEQGIVPEELKTAKVTPLFKGGNKEYATNYRPISNLPIFAKILEGLIYERLSQYFISKNLLSTDQYGFRQGKSTKGALIRFINHIENNIDQGQKTGAVYIDLKKAFDTVDHQILLRKMEKYGIRGLPLEWFKSYLDARCQYIHNKGKNSPKANIKCGVPQGSNLGPLLFLIYVNDLPYCLKNMKATLFADDTTLSLATINIRTLQEKMNGDLQSLEDWFKANKLTLNVNKSYGCIFGGNPQEKPKIQISGQEIEISDCVRYLGVNVDAKLIWTPHITSVANKIGQTLGALSKIRHQLTEPALKTIYYALIHSKLLYCQEVWATASKTAIQPLIVAQKKAVRLIVGAPYRAHSQPIFNYLKIRPLGKEIEYRRALLAYELVKSPGTYDIYLQNVHSHMYGTRFTTNRLPIPRKRTQRYGTQGIENSLILAYNSLPDEVRAREYIPNKKQYKEIFATAFPI